MGCIGIGRRRSGGVFKIVVDGLLEPGPGLIHGDVGKLGGGHGEMPPAPRASMITWTLTAPMLRAERFTPVPEVKRMKEASTPLMFSSSSAAWEATTRMSSICIMV